MKFIIIGSGIVGLSIAKVLIDKKLFEPSKILILDKYAIPSKGTSLRNSGVLHAGLYYKPGSLKAKLSVDGGKKLKSWCKINKLEFLECGKLLIPFNSEDINNLDKIKDNAEKNGCEIKIIDYKEAIKIQPGLVKQEKYLWSPKTGIFSPHLIIKSLYESLKEKGVQFLKKSVKTDDSENNQLVLQDNTKLKYFKYVNAAGAGALDIAKSVTDKFNNLSILPFLGQYVTQNAGIEIKTNLYPVPDPELPFLGIHLTPRIKNSALIGPNAIPILNKDIQGYDFNDIKSIPSIIKNNIVLFTSNKNNYRKHAINEFSLNLQTKFYNNSKKYFSKKASKNFEIKLDKSTYGIRAQLFNNDTLSFENDFIYESINNNIHIVNAVSPAFTSSFSIAELILNNIEF